MARGTSGRWDPLLGGYSVHAALGDAYFIIPEKKYRDYYWPSALHFRAFMGTRVFWGVPNAGRKQGIAAIAEVGAIDAYWSAYFHNETVRLRDILSLALAVQFYVRLAKP